VITNALPLDIVAGPIALSSIAVIALVWCDVKELRTGRYLFKPLAAAAFVWLALSLGATTTPYGTWLLTGLICCLIGDLLLMPDSERFFLAGLSAFLCGHLFFAVAFMQLPINLAGLAVTSLPAILLLLLVRRWLSPHLPTQMKWPVALYVLVISGMLLCAGLTAGQPAAIQIIVGAWGFALSDLAVARRQFVNPSRINSLWGTPLYFISQMILASSLALV
jgi:uncharacterized membrane protein YhhN